MAYQPIESYGIIGNMRTAALVSHEGSIDWFCGPAFDSPSIFGALLDDRRGGRFSVRPLCTEMKSRQMYLPDTNVLLTRFLAQEGVAEVADYMALGSPEATECGLPLVRQLRVTRGAVTFRVVCEPAFNYARDSHETVITRQGAFMQSATASLTLSSPHQLKRTEHGVTVDIPLKEGESVSLVLACGRDETLLSEAIHRVDKDRLFDTTLRFWRSWIARSTYSGRWREVVERSALALKLLTYEPTGAIVASPTAGLPEFVGGPRNWDYRYTWLRDAAFTLYGFMRIGFTGEAEAFMRWLEARCHELEPDGQLQIVYGINGEHLLDETSLTHLDGYMGSRPVRIGNDAYKQLQLDIYGELMDSVYLYNKYGQPISYDLWVELRRLLEWVCNNWQQPDEGIWEVRSGRADFVYSKLMCWVALDRGIRLAEKRSFPADRAKWIICRDTIYETIMQRGWCPDRKTFVQAFGSHTLDASNLIMPLVFFMSPTDPRMVQTIEAMNRSPREGGLVSDSLVYRYDTELWSDGVDGREGTFNMCSFWLVEALTRAAQTPRELEKARLLFERMLSYANHVGLYGEQTGMHGEALGNFPQAFTHLALISAAFNLDRKLGRRH
jgi:GH15 family glucan-1,4-alpha-glucosidase